MESWKCFLGMLLQSFSWLANFLFSSVIRKENFPFPFPFECLSLTSLIESSTLCYLLGVTLRLIFPLKSVSLKKYRVLKPIILLFLQSRILPLLSNLIRFLFFSFFFFWKMNLYCKEKQRIQKESLLSRKEKHIKLNNWI